MEPFFNDINAALNNVGRHIGYTEVVRQGKTWSFSDFRGYTILLNLLAETGVTPAAKQWAAAFHFSKAVSKGANVSNSLFLYGTPRSYCPVQPGDLFPYTAANGDIKGAIAIQVNKNGEPTLFFTFQNTGREEKLILQQELVPLARISQCFTLSVSPRTLPDNPSMAAFYGNWKNLLSYIMQAGILSPDLIGSTIIGGTNYSNLENYKSETLLRLLAAKGPAASVERFFWQTDTYACATLGEGLKTYTKGTPLPFGTIVFIGTQSNCGVVVLNDGNGCPAAVLSCSDDSYIYNPAFTIHNIDTADIRYYWSPAVSAYKYMAAPDTALYKDMNLWLGKLRCLKGKHDYTANSPGVLQHSFVLDSNYLQPDYITLLKKTPASIAGSTAFLSKYGKGVQPATTGASPGDILLLKNGGTEQSAIALDNATMICKEQNTNIFEVKNIANVSGIWKPSLQPK